MKILFLFLSLFLTTNLFGATCTSISRSNYSANSVLGSSALNTDFNTVYNAANALDGGCITDNTLELSALNTTDFSGLLNGIVQGCKVSYSDANTLSVGKCLANVNGFNIRTTVATTVTWGCTSCSAEVASTLYYLYIKTGSTGTTLNLLISTTAPNEDGYDNSNNKVIAKFYNNVSSDIDQYSISQWLVNSFVYPHTAPVGYSPTTRGFGTPTIRKCTFQRFGMIAKIICSFTAGTVNATRAQVTLPSGMLTASSTYLDTTVVPNRVGVCGKDQVFVTDGQCVVNAIAATDNVQFGFENSGIAGTSSLATSSQFSNGNGITFYADVPIAGWD